VGGFYLSLCLLSSSKIIEENVASINMLSLIVLTIILNFFDVRKNILLILTSMCLLLTQGKETYIIGIMILIVIVFEVKKTLLMRKNILLKNHFGSKLILKFVIKDRNKVRSEAKEISSGVHDMQNRKINENGYSIKSSVINNSIMVYIAIMLMIAVLLGGPKWLY
jgi:hypothetical protein